MRYIRLMQSDKILVSLVQINNSFSGQKYLPYSAGILQAYAQKYLKNPNKFSFNIPVYFREPIQESVKKLKSSHYVFFSTYVWNIKLSLEISKKLKESNPNVVIIFGGPQVPDRIEGFLKQYPFIDAVVHGEGEQTFVDILELGLDKAIERNWLSIQSVSYIKDGTVTTNPKRERIHDISVIPSPYLEGVFADIMKENPDQKWIMMWETNRGCPFSCAYCDWGSSTQSKVFKFDMDRIQKEIQWMSENKIEFVFCADANFGMLERDYEIVKNVADYKERSGFPHALSVQNTKNATERAYKVQKLLSDTGLNKGVTIALQSTDPVTLTNVKRANISTKSYQELQRRFTRDRVDTYSDIILGLPGETYESFVKGVCECIENGQHNRIQFGNLSILPNAAMGDLEYQKKYKLEIVECPVANIHGSIDASEDEVIETQQLVISNYSCSREDWAKTRAFAWMCSFLYFNKVLQIPLLVLHSQFKIPFKDLMTLFTDSDLKMYPILNAIRTRLVSKAKNIQEGGPEYEASQKWLGIWWPIDELILIEICNQNQLDQFYEESQKLMKEFLSQNHYMVDETLMGELFQLNKLLIKKPFVQTDIHLKLNYNIWEVYNAAKVNDFIPLMNQSSEYQINRSKTVWNTWQDWCREVIWWGNKKGAYLYSNLISEKQVSGHY